jgi:tetratricopeptide (TPR) repeat protein
MRRSLFLFAIVVCAIWLSTAPAFTQGNAAPADQEIQQARQAFDAVNFEAVRDGLTPLIGRLSQSDVDESQRKVLAAAYELRGRALLNLRDQDAARADFRSMLMLEPNYPLPPEAGSRAAALFEEVRAATVGFVEVAVTPVDAEVQIDGHVVPDRPLRVALVSGFHAIKASRRGHASLQQQFEVRPGESTTLPLALTRELTTLTLRTVPASVTVVLDGAARGTTQPDTATTPPADGGNAPSQPLIIEDLPNGTHRLELRRDCFVTDERQINLQKPEDLKLDVVRLTPAVGTISVRSQAGGTLFVDDKEHGTTPQVVEQCRGPHVLEVRTRTGRDIRRVDVKTGSKDEFDAVVRPAFAIVADATAAGGDGRLRAESALNASRSVLFFAPAKARVDEVAASTRVPADWLAVDATGRPSNVAFTPAARRAAGERFAQVLETQGVAAIAQDGSDPRAMVLTLMAPGSAKPDVLHWRADDAASVRELVARLDAVPVLTRRSLGMLALDVLDVQGVVVGRVDPDGGAAAAGVQPGDVITAAAGQPLTNVAGLLTAMAGASGPQLSLDVRDRSGAVRKVDVPVRTLPYVTPPSDETVLANARAVALTARLATPAASAPVDAASLRLNLASAWMHLENWDAAVRELTQVEALANGSQLPANVKDAIVGNAQYLLGVCAARTGDASGAEQAWTKAAASSGRLMSESGEPLKELAERQLAELQNRAAPR